MELVKIPFNKFTNIWKEGMFWVNHKFMAELWIMNYELWIQIDLVSGSEILHPSGRRSGVTKAERKEPANELRIINYELRIWMERWYIKAFLNPLRQVPK